MRNIWALGVCLVCFTVQRPALAEAAAERSRDDKFPATSPRGTFSAALLAGYGFAYRPEFEWRDDLGAGYGVRAGDTGHATPLYLGGTLLVYQRSSGEAQLHNGTLDVELGYELSAASLAIRPYLGVGAALFFSDGSDGGGSGIGVHAALGLLVKYRMGSFEVGLDGRYERASSLVNHFAILGSVGVAL